MALEISPTPILCGQDATTFLRNVEARAGNKIVLKSSSKIHESIKCALIIRGQSNNPRNAAIDKVSRV